MNLEDIQFFCASIDPDIRHYFTTETKKNYSYWEEINVLPLLADDHHEPAWRFAIHRFTRIERDPVVRRLFDVLENDDRIAYSYTSDFEQDTGYIHHVFTCEGY